MQAIFEFALHRRARLQEAHFERAKRDFLQLRRDVAAGDAKREPFDDGGFSHARFTGQDRIVLPAAHEHIDDLPNFFIAADDVVDLALAGFFREIDGDIS